ncbi:MAG: hypothetical protein ACRENE_00445, partial [Polyangiaceae bacterium]
MRLRLGRSFAWLTVAWLGAASCSPSPKGGLMLAVSTDLQVPKDIDVLSVFVATGGKTKFDYLARLAPQGTLELPATLAIVEPGDPGAQVRIRVIGFEEQNARVLRDVITTVPAGTISLLRVPLDYLDLGSASGTIPANLLPGGAGGAPDGETTFDPTTVMSSCDITKGQTSIDGVCTSATVVSSSLPPFDPVQVYGQAGTVPATGAPAKCFDVGACLQGAAPVAGLDPTSCTFALAAGVSASSVNLALVTPADGVCVAPGRCLVPLVEDPSLGWTESKGTVSLPPGVCKKVAGVDVVMTAGTCPAEIASEPVCQPATADAGGVPPEATILSEASDDGAGEASPEASAAAPDATIDAAQDAPGDSTLDVQGDTTVEADAQDDGGSADAPEEPCDGPTCACAAADACSGSVVFSYTGASQSFVVPLWVSQVTVVANGAGGGADGCFNNTAGGTTGATISVTPGETLTVMVGGAGGTGSNGGVGGTAGFNGGAAGGTNSLGGNNWGGGGGGGASDVRQGGTSLADRVVVAGGGGGVAGGFGGGTGG